MKHCHWFPAVSVLILAIAALMTIAYLPIRSSLDFRVSDLNESLKQNQGRERKQQAEYEKVCTDLPAAQAQLEALQPQADAAAARVSELKAVRKALRAEKEALLTSTEEEKKP